MTSSTTANANATPTPNATPPLRTAATSPHFAYSVEPLGPGVYAFVEPHQTSMLVSGNSLVVVGDDGVLVVDTGHFPSLARKMIADIRKITPLPVRYVVTTHWHADHLFGNSAFREAFPDAVFVAHEETRRLVIKNDAVYVDVQRKTAKYVELYKQIAAGGKVKGREFTADERAGVAATVPDLEQTVDDTDLDLVPPTATFRDELTLYLGKREVRVLHLGRGNTAGDAMVYVPDAKVLATGDVLVAPTPYAYGSYPGEWIDVLKKVEGIDATAILPGHGPVQRDLSYVRSLEGLFGAVRSQVAESVKAGLTLEQARARLDVARFARSMAGDDAGDVTAFRVSFVEPAVERAYQEAKGKLEEE